MRHYRATIPEALLKDDGDEEQEDASDTLG
jgi:hypothetical protein